MVVRVLAAATSSFGPIATEKARPLIDRLDGATKARVLAALAALIILGFAMVLLTWLGGRAVKRYMNSGAGSSGRPLEVDDWAAKSLVEGEQDVSEE